MHVKVKTLLGKIYNDITVEPDQTIENLKDVITAKIPAIPRKGQKIVFAGQLLEGDNTIGAANIKDGDFVVVFTGRTTPLPSIDPIPEPNAQAILAATTQHINFKEQIEDEAEKENDEDKDKMEVEQGDEKQTPAGPLSEGMLKGLVDTIVGSLSPQFRKGSRRGSKGSNPSAASGEGETESASPRLPTVDPTMLRQLQDMGFAENRARKALLLHKMNGQLAMEWLLMHNEDPDIDDPLSPEQLRVISEAEATFEPNAETARQLQEMGFDAESVNQALRVTRNNQESALAWLLGDRGGFEEGDEKGSDEEDDEDDDIDAGELVQALLNHPRVKEALGEPRVVSALEKLMENPGSLDELLADEEIGPILQQLNNLINNEL